MRNNLEQYKEQHNSLRVTKPFIMRKKPVGRGKQNFYNKRQTKKEYSGNHTNKEMRKKSRIQKIEDKI
jgi:hypothetical protein